SSATMCWSPSRGRLRTRHRRLSTPLPRRWEPKRRLGPVTGTSEPDSGPASSTGPEGGGDIQPARFYDVRQAGSPLGSLAGTIGGFALTAVVLLSQVTP